jgi:serine protease
MPVKVLDAMGWGSFATVADGIRFAADNGANVINLSLGGPFPSRSVEKAVRYARSRAVVVIAAAGNSGGGVDYPGASPYVVAVSATDPQDKLAPFSSRGAGVDIAAPGVGVVQQSICEGGKNQCELFPSWSGTSMAAPHVAGAAALLASLGVTRPEAVEKLLLSTATRVDDSKQGRAQFGSGIVDAGAAVTRAALRKVVARTVALSLLIYVVFRWARRRGRESLSPWRPGFLFMALLTGPGLLFFAPLLLPRTTFVVDMLSRPLADWDLLFSVQLHSGLPLANVFVPLGVSLLLLNVRGLRGALAGMCVGTASYLVAEVLLQDLAFPFGAVALTAWCVVNALLCATLARLILAKSAAASG